jgi:F-type H+-transporting ATPase subunit delta
MHPHTRAARRYANALFGLALTSGVWPAVRDDYQALHRATAQSSDLAAFLANTLLPPSQRAAALRALFETRLHPLSFRFLRFLESKRRMRLLPLICHHLADFDEQLQGIVRGRVWAPFPLGPSDLQFLTARFESLLASGKHLHLDFLVNPDLIAGVRLRVGDRVHDYSAAAQLRRLGRTLNEARLKEKTHGA